VSKKLEERGEQIVADLRQWADDLAQAYPDMGRGMSAWSLRHAAETIEMVAGFAGERP
jgi:hypothetical protein